MQFRNSNLRYGAIAQLLHWSIVVLIVTQFVLANQAEGLRLGPQKLALLATHKSYGMTVFVLALLRLTWRLLNPVPDAPAGTKTWQHRLANVTHWALYALILLMPLAGLLMSSAKNYPVSYFGWFTWPNLVEPNEQLFDFFKKAHAFLALCIFALASLHILAALKHHFVDKDNVLRRMLPVKLRSDQQ